MDKPSIRAREPENLVQILPLATRWVMMEMAKGDRDLHFPITAYLPLTMEAENMRPDKKRDLREGLLVFLSL